jgi:hypothetical protein
MLRLISTTNGRIQSSSTKFMRGMRFGSMYELVRSICPVCVRSQIADKHMRLRVYVPVLHLVAPHTCDLHVRDRVVTVPHAWYNTVNASSRRTNCQELIVVMAADILTVLEHGEYWALATTWVGNPVCMCCGVDLSNPTTPRNDQVTIRYNTIVRLC